jgi:hypothetical protein
MLLNTQNAAFRMFEQPAKWLDTEDEAHSSIV